MIVSGNSRVKRPVYIDSNGFQFDTIFSTEPTDFTFGILGDSITKVKISSGKIFDENNKFVTFFENDKTNSIVYRNSNISLVKDQKAYSCYGDRESVISGDSYIFFENNSESNVSLEAYLKSSKANVSYLTSATTDSLNFSGSIVNNSDKKVVLFDYYGENITRSGFSSSIFPGQTGYFQYSIPESGDISGSHRISFDYNFGNEYSDVLYYNPNLEDSPTGYINYSFVSPSKLQSSTIDITYNWEVDTDLSIEFVYDSGYGDISSVAHLYDAVGSGEYNGYVIGTGPLYSSNMVGTGKYSFYSNGSLFTGIATGSGGLGTIIHTLVGPVNLNYSVTAQGYESGVLAQGIINGQLLVNLTESDSGKYTFSSFPVTGTPSYSTEVSGLGVFVPATGSYTGYLNGEYTLEGYATVNSSSSMTGATGNVVIGSKNLTNTFRFTSGFLGVDVPVDYYSGNMYSGNSYSGTSRIPAGLHYIQAELFYDGVFINTIDSGRIIISNGITTEELSFYGL